MKGVCETNWWYRMRLLDILNNGGFQAPIIVFVNQKKTADMVARDLSRSGVCSIFAFHTIAVTKFFANSGTHRRYTQARTKNNARPLYKHSAQAKQTYSLQPIWLDVVLTCKMCHSLSTTKWQTLSKLMCIVSVSHPFQPCNLVN